MVAGKRPAPQNGEDLLLLYPESTAGKVVEARPKDFDIYRRLTEVREKKSELKARETTLKNKLKETLGDAERLVCRGKTLVSWKTYERSRLDSTKLREQKPEIYENYRTSSSYRRFSVK